MLHALRRGAATWVAKIFIAILVLSFAVWGIADIFGGYGQNDIGSVGDVEITQADYQRAYQNEINLLSQQLQRRVNPQMARNLGIESRVLTRLVAGAALDSHANKLGLSVSEEALLNLIRQDPAFHGSDGRFNRLAFDQALRNAGISEQSYVTEKRESAVRGQLTGIIAAPPPTSKTILDAWNNYWNARREVEYFVLTEKAAGKIPDPSQEDLNSYYESNKSKYIAPQFRELSVLLVDPDILKKDIEISDADVKTFYDENIKRYTVPEKRLVEQIPFTDKASAAEASAKIKSGKSFAEIAKEQGIPESELPLGNVTKEELFDKAIAEAAFALKKDEVSAPVEGTLSTVILRVTEITPGVTRSFDEMKDKIKDDLQKEKATDTVLSLYDDIEDARSEGSTFTEIGQTKNLKFFTITTDKQGKDLEGKEIKDLSSKRNLISSAFDSDVGIENDAVELFGGAYAWYEVAKVIPARTRTFEEARKDVETQWRVAQIKTRLTEKADDLVKKAKAGETMKALAKSIGAKLEEPISFRRSANLKGFPRSATTLAFTLQDGEVATSAQEDGPGRVIYKLIKKIPADTLAGDAKTRFEEQISGGIVDDLLAQYLTGLQNDFGTNIDQQAISRIQAGGHGY